VLEFVRLLYLIQRLLFVCVSVNIISWGGKCQEARDTLLGRLHNTNNLPFGCFDEFQRGRSLLNEMN
jgi:hypothetical protein